MDEDFKKLLKQCVKQQNEKSNNYIDFSSQKSIDSVNKENSVIKYPKDSESKDKPTKSIIDGDLGALFDNNILLKTAQSSYNYPLLTLSGAMVIEFEIDYISDQNYKGIFGLDRYCSYEKSFVAIDRDNYRLNLSDGRWFRFEREGDGFIDCGGLGVEVRELGQNRFELLYYNGLIEIYNHNLIEVRDSNNNTIVLSYNNSSQITKIENSSGSFILFKYNQNGFVEALKDSGDRVWVFKYDTSGYLKFIASQNEIREQYDYININGNYYLSHVYDIQKRPILSLYYNNRGEIEGYNEAEERFTYRWHTPNLIEKEDNQGKTYLFELDDTGRISAITYPDGSYTQEIWDRDSLNATIITRGGKEIEKRFDKRYRVLEIESEGEVESYEYQDKNPNPISYTKEDETTYYEYDKNYNLLKITYHDKTTQLYSYTKEGLTESETDAIGNTIRYKYNSQSQLTAQIDANDKETQFEYNKLSLVSAVILADGTIQRFDYDIEGRIIRYKNALNDSLEFGYTPSGKLKSIIDPAKRVTLYHYDEYERVKTKIYPSSDKNHPKTEQYEYNQDNTLKSIIRVDGSRLYFSYDENQNITKIVAKDNNTQEELNYSYDTLSNLEEASTPHHKIEFFYNKKANIIIEEQNGIEVNSNYSENQEELKSLEFLGQSIDFEYDKSHNLSKIDSPNQSIELEYDKNGTITQRVYQNGTKEEMKYDKGYNLLSIKNNQLETNYTHNELGLIETKLRSDEEDATLCRYNPRGELIQAGIEDFNYSIAGNQLLEGSRYNIENQLLETKTHIYTYDKRGNLKTKTHKNRREETVYIFTLFNQLVKVEKTTQNGIELFEYAYDALNRRVTKTHTINGIKTTHYYLYNGHNIVAILDTNREILASITHDTKIDTPLSITTYPNQKTYYYHRDHQGSITSLTNQKGEVVESWLYDNSYGKILKHHKSVETLNPYCYTGREFESDELYYYRARYYDPTIGRFLSCDPIEFIGGDFNFYRYVVSNPVNFVDPSGLNTLVLGGELGAEAGTLILPGVGTVVGAILGTIAGGLIGWWIISDSSEKVETKTKVEPDGIVIEGTDTVPPPNDPCKKHRNKLENNQKELEKEFEKYNPSEDLKGGHTHAHGVTTPCGHYEEMLSFLSGLIKNLKHIERMSKEGKCFPPPEDSKNKIDSLKDKFKQKHQETSQICKDMHKRLFEKIFK